LQDERQRRFGQLVDAMTEQLFGYQRDGREFPVKISLSPLRSPNGTLVSAAVRDISKRKETELQLAYRPKSSN
jgi:PAS domain S-box-containing protein